MNSNSVGLLVMHYGTPASMDEIMPYYTHIRRGNPPSPEAFEDLRSRYESIGGPSPLVKISEKQAAKIQEGLKARRIDAKLYIGAKHTAPFVGDVVKQMAADGIDEIVAMVLAPHYSSYSVASYTKSAVTARDEVKPSMSIEVLQRWGTLPEFVEALANNVLTQAKDFDLKETLVIFSAHSLPERILSAGEPYKDELLETSALVAEKAGIPNWTFAFQSASTTGEPWLGPDILDVIERESANYKNVICCTVGFVSDHLEVLYDLGVEARDKCAEHGLGFRRAECINDDSKVMDALAGRLVEILEASREERLAPQA